MNTGFVAPNLAYFYGLGTILILIGVGLLCYVAIKVSWRRKQQRRARARYVFDDMDRIIGREAPPPAHGFCTRIVCYAPDSPAPCTHGRPYP